MGWELDGLVSQCCKGIIEFVNGVFESYVWQIFTCEEGVMIINFSFPKYNSTLPFDLFTHRSLNRLARARLNN